MKYVTWVLSAMVVGLAIGASVHADDKIKATSDTDFLIKATSCGNEEVNISGYAAKHASDDKVKEFAQQLVNDHKELNSSIATNAKRLKVAVVAGLEKDAKARMDKLTQLKGDDFDVEYLKQQIDGHENAIALFESESKNGNDADLKAVANDNLATLKKHLKTAQDLLAKIKK
jgi:putative membrane protein